MFFLNSSRFAPPVITAIPGDDFVQCLAPTALVGCPQASLLPSAVLAGQRRDWHKGNMKKTISELGKAYKPEKVKCLFVAESPPESNDNEVRFFYNPRQERWDHMYRSVMKAVFPYFEYRPGEKDKWLRFIFAVSVARAPIGVYCSLW